MKGKNEKLREIYRKCFSALTVQFSGNKHVKGDLCAKNEVFKE
jgi:hypothetical protein